VNHKSADLKYREWLARAFYKRLHSESDEAQKLSCILLLTCHRAEVYFSSEDLAGAHSMLLHVLREEISSPFEHKLYAYFGSDCFAHLAQVTAGLDSMIIAESEIQRQVKKAYEQTCLHYPLPSAMHYLFQKSLGLGKYLRSHRVFPKEQITIPRMVYELCSHLFSDIEKKEILFIGNSEINRKVLGLFKHKGIDRVALCTRSAPSARDMAQEQELELLDWSQLALWGNYDVVISGTNASSFLIRSGLGTIKTRLIFDLGVPRNVDPKLSRHPHISLFNIDELGQMMQKRQATHLEAIKESEGMILEKVDYYMI
jgi:glutamyl-tRNA reductase